MSSKITSTEHNKEELARDNSRFEFLALNGRAELPNDFSENVPLMAAHERVKRIIAT